MRINKLTGKDVAKQAKKDLARSGQSGTPSPFALKLQKSGQENQDYHQEMQDLKKEIDLAGEELGKEPTISNFRKFRDLIGTLVRKASNEAYRLEKVGGTPQQPICHEAIIVINREADALYRLIMQEQKDHLKIAAKIQEIRGLVVDILT